MQHILVIIVVVGALAVVAVQAVRTLRGKGSFGACCAKGCKPVDESLESAEKKPAERVVFMPIEMLSRRR